MEVIISTKNVLNHSVLYDGIQCEEKFKMNIPLTLATKMNLSLSAITRIIESNPFGLFDIDCMGRLPLHIACEFGAHPDVIKKLAMSNEPSVTSRDMKGRNPLMVACESYIESYDQQGGEENAKECLMEVVESLLSIQPECILQEDTSGLCCIERAIISDVDIEVIETLQKASEKERKRQQKRRIDYEGDRLCKMMRLC